MTKVFDGQTANGDSTTFLPVERELGITVKGDLETGSLTMQVKDSDGAWNVVKGFSTITTNGFYTHTNTVPLSHKLVLAGVTTASNLTVEVYTFHVDTKRIGNTA